MYLSGIVNNFDFFSEMCIVSTVKTTCGSYPKELNHHFQFNFLLSLLF
jgi:hypothetical protein